MEKIIKEITLLMDFIVIKIRFNVPQLNFPEPTIPLQKNKISSFRNSESPKDIIIFGHKSTSRQRKELRDTLLTIAQEEPKLQLKP